MSGLEAIARWLAEHRDDMVAELEELVTFESPSTEKDHVDALIALLANRTRALSANVVRAVPGEANNDALLATWEGGGGQPVLLLCHCDTVFPLGTVGGRPFAVHDGHATGPGVFDMKAGIVIGLWAMRALTALRVPLPHSIRLLVNGDEEIGSEGSKELIRAQAREAKYALVLEPAKDGMVKTARKGWARYTLAVEGRAAHAGADPELGVSAVHEIARQIVDIAALANTTAGTTLNVGVVRGGTGGNIVAAEARAEIDCRFATVDEARRIARAIENARPHDPAARVRAEGGINRLPLERTAEGVLLYERARGVAASLGFALGETSTGGVSDGNLAAEVGCAVLDGLGAVGAGAHGLDEWVDVASLPERAALLAGLLVL